MKKGKIRHLLFSLLLVSSFSVKLSASTDVHTRAQYNLECFIFKASSSGPYHSYRIPSIVRAKNGNLIAFCEGRKNSNRDYGDIDVVYKISEDNGVTWLGWDGGTWSEEAADPKVLFSKQDGTCGNPTAVADYVQGNLWIFMSYNTADKNQKGDNGYEKIDSYEDRKVYRSVSMDNGYTWEQAVNLTRKLKPAEHADGRVFAWDAMGPGNGIQLQSGPFQGRLIIPAVERNIYSDDYGNTWDYETIPGGTGEGTIVELSEGHLMRNDRATGQFLARQDDPTNRRYTSVSYHDDYAAYLGWSDWRKELALMDPICEASILRYTFGDTP